VPGAAFGAASLFVSMAHAPAPAQEGTSIMLEFEVSNQGDAASGAVVLQVSCANTQPQGPPCSFAGTTKSLGVLQPGSEANVGPFLTQPWQAGTYELTTSLGGRGRRATVKTFDLVVSSSQKKPTAGVAQKGPAAAQTGSTTPAATISRGPILQQIPRPDLTVDLDLPNNANDVLRAKVRNVGTAASAATTLQVTCEKKCDQFPWLACTGWPKTVAVPALASGAAKDLVFSQQLPAWPMYYCWNKFSAKVDPANQVLELDDSNNLDGGTISGPSSP
jgi:hypothetical protein